MHEEASIETPTGVFCCSARWAAIVGCAEETESLCIAAQLGNDNAWTRVQLRESMQELRGRGAERIIVLCDGRGPLPSGAPLFIVEDHVNLTGDNPLIGLRGSEPIDRFLDMAEPYDRAVRSALGQAAEAADVAIQSGVAVDGPYPDGSPKLEGAIHVRSIAPVVIAARHAGFAVGAVAWLDGSNGTGRESGGLDETGIHAFWASAAKLLAADAGVS